MKISRSEGEFTPSTSGHCLKKGWGPRKRARVQVPRLFVAEFYGLW